MSVPAASSTVKERVGHDVAYASSLPPSTHKPLLQHFQRHLVVAIVDCNTTRCERSVYHPRGCRSTTCARNFGPEIQRDVDAVDDFCWACKSAAERAARGPSAGVPGASNSPSPTLPASRPTQTRLSLPLRYPN
ncbi:hypothetical protein MKEN_01325700 [Mycena kentingensis (nom. inval.)]|nr:hypothetical protein MKEN_01325700 [Mycena kentingensis (nom. inval.)]